MNTTLIVYHSRTGHTRKVAQALAERLHADLQEIRIVQPLAGVAGYLMCCFEAMAGLTPALRPGHRDPAPYRLVVIGTPVWCWSLSSPVRSWLTAHRLQRRVGFFCTMGGSGSERVFATMADLVGKAPQTTLALTEKEVAGDHRGKLAAFVARLSPDVHRRPARAPARSRATPAPAH